MVLSNRLFLLTKKKIVKKRKVTKNDSDRKKNKVEMEIEGRVCADTTIKTDGHKSEASGRHRTMKEWR